MRTIVAGSRKIEDYKVVDRAISLSKFTITEIVSGAARGVDRLGEKYAVTNNIPTKQFPAEWDKYGKSAGYRRNEQMAAYADALVAIWDGSSPGTRHMIDTAHQQGLKVFVYRLDREIH